MKRRCRIAFIFLLCCLPMLVAGMDRTWISPWRGAELDACVGDYVLPSGLLLRVRREENLLEAGALGVEMRRAARWLYVARSTSMRLRFHVDNANKVRGLHLSGICPKTYANKSDDASDSAVMVNVGDHSLRVNIAGKQHDGPTVLLETGPMGGLEGVSQWQADVAEFARVVAYDHPGTGGSQRGPTPQTARIVSEQLREALRVLAVEPPYVIAGMSMGGPYSRVFAHQFSDEIAGLVWIDPTPDWRHLYDWCAKNSPSMGRKVKRAMQWTNLSIQTGFKSSREPGRKSEWESMDLTWDEVRTSHPLPHVPIVQITGAENYRTRDGAALKVKYFSEWLSRNTPQAEHVLAENSRHGVYGTEPELVLDSIRRVLGANLK